MNTEELKGLIVTNVYHISADKKVALHKHTGKDEVCYCMGGTGYGVLESSEQPLSVGKTSVVKAGTTHALRTDSDLYVASFFPPTLE